MNRLILVGNGFDLAHKLKTSYCDFVTDYISNVINCFYEKFVSIDPLIEIKQKYAGYNIRVSSNSTSKSAIQELKNLQGHSSVVVEIKSDFLRGTLNRISDINWVDLENEYFDHLLKLRTPNGFIFNKVKELNIEFEFLKTKLEEYLVRHQKESDRAFSNDYTTLFCEEIKRNDIVTISVKDQVPKQVLILSFNYTSTLEKYKDSCKIIVPTQLNYIHGELESNSNPIIFGFGDEYNKNYQEFENIRNKELLKHIKSFSYFKTSNYHNLIRFIDADDFQVYILGHSLGLSDRTMLRQIFEHHKCKSVKIFYHQTEDGKDDYTDKTFDISSHFTDKGEMRKKIVPFNLSFPMPQPGLLK